MRSLLSRAFGTGAKRPRPQDAFLSAIQKGGYNQNFQQDYINIDNSLVISNISLLV
jgi:hypothetical protein